MPEAWCRKRLSIGARPDALVLNSADMDLDEITRVYTTAFEKGQDVARVQTGDLSIYSSLAEQTRRLDELGIDWTVVPGVSSFQASAAALGQELTLPEECQTIILSRASGRTPVPEKENLKSLAQHDSDAVSVFKCDSDPQSRARVERGLSAKPGRFAWWKRRLIRSRGLFAEHWADIAEKNACSKYPLDRNDHRKQSICH